MADFSKLSPDAGTTILNCKDAAARSQITDVYKVMGEMGAWNMLTYPYVDTTKTSGHITFTDNGDGTITANGNNDNSYIMFSLISANDANAIIQKYGSLVLSGCPTGGSTNTYCVYTQSTTKGYLFDYGNGIVIDTADLTDSIYIQIRPNYSANNVKFYPALSPKKINYYQKFTLTNRLLTDKVVGGFYPAFASSATISDVIKGVAQSFVNKGIEDGETHIIRTSINMVGYCIVSLTKAAGRILGYAIKDDITFYVYNYDISNQSITVKSATLT